MDYILFGAGTGASLAVIGWILREWGPRLRDGKSDEGVIYSASELIDRMSWARFCASCGMALVVAGTLILLATAVVAAWNPGDDLASWILIGAYVFVSLLMLVWAFLYTRQFGTSGIYRPVTVDPATEMREAVPVVERESAATPEDVSPERIPRVSPDAEPSPEPVPDFAEVAARRGGLGRFGAFFNRQRPAAVDDDGADLRDEQADIEVEQTEDEPRNLQRVPVIEVISETDEEPAETITTVDTAVESAPDDVDEAATVEVAPDAADASETAAPTEPTSKDESEAASSEATVETPAQVASPEDDALAELRRRRLERLSTGDS